MNQSFNRVALLAAGLLLAGSGQAQVVKFCSNTLVANAAYSQVATDGKTSVITYYLQLQNQDPQRRTVTVVMGRIGRIGPFTPVQLNTSPVDLAGNEQKAFTALKINVSNPSGQGAPAADEVARQLFFTCNFRQP